ncbi:MAG: hypothetical protein OXG44_01510 [Gammaproteobacteria bacterium]|nr:hypothetical protein [Gammaproteobacteria bacterium]
MDILNGLVAGELFEGLDGDRSLEEQVLIGAALSQLADEISKAAREQALKTYGGTTGKQIDGRLMIEWRPGGQQTRVDSAAVRKDLPPDDYPMYWKTVQTKESIRITIAERRVDDLTETSYAPPADLDSVPPIPW